MRADTPVDKLVDKRVPPVLLVGAAAITQGVLARGSSTSRASVVSAGILATASATLLASAVRSFRHHGTTVDPVAVDRAAALVTSGPFGMTRNPMYVGMTGLLLAQAVLRRSWTACLPVVAFVTWVDRVQIPAEERALREEFGHLVDEYAREVPRWLDGCSVRAIIRPDARRAD